MIYFIQQENYIKIGFTTNPIRRVNTIQVSLPIKLNVLLIIDGDVKLEKEIHNLFSTIRTRGEWFLFDSSIEDYIKSRIKFDLRYKYGYGESIKNELMPVRKHRIDCGLTLDQLGYLIGMTKQGVKNLEQSANKGTITINKMQKIAKATGYKFEFRFIKE